MSSQPQSGQPQSGATPQSPHAPESALFWRIIDHLAPLFAISDTDRPAARQAARAALAACHPETVFDLIDAGRFIAFSFSALAALSHAARRDTPPEAAERLFSSATRMNHAATRADRAVRQRTRPARPAAEPRQPAPPPNPAQDAARDAMIEAAIDQLFARSGQPQSSTPARPGQTQPVTRTHPGQAQPATQARPGQTQPGTPARPTAPQPATPAQAAQPQQTPQHRSAIAAAASAPAMQPASKIPNAGTAAPIGRTAPLIARTG